MVAGNDSAEDGYEYPQELPSQEDLTMILEPWPPQGEQDTELLHNEIVYQMSRNSASDDNNFSKENPSELVEFAECHSVLFIDRIQMRLHDTNDPWALEPNNGYAELEYRYNAGVATPADYRCGNDALTLAKSLKSKTTFYTAPSQLGSVAVRTTKPRLQGDSEYAQILAKKNLWPVDPLIEQNWSGRGQHVEFRKDERRLVNELLEVIDTLGKGSSAIVESVKCRRILLARKTIFCNRNLTKAEAISEVAHLTRLSHSHVVRLIGTYTLGRELSILTYPVAEQNLEEFLHTFSLEISSDKIYEMSLSIEKFFACLSDTLHYIHRNLVKHVDIKSQNLFVRKIEPLHRESSPQYYKIYLADFGISRSYQRSEEVETNGPTGFTRKYAAPEVIDQGSRGFPADVFSLGCVFLKIFASLHDYSNVPDVESSMQDSIQAILDNNTRGLRCYYANIDRLTECIFPDIGRIRDGSM